jgi:hypothetical protein
MIKKIESDFDVAADIALQESDIIRHPIYTHVITDTLKTNIVSQMCATVFHKCYIVFPKPGILLEDRA